jgi:phosphoenolpyruvate carboxykinase (GTP)
VPISAILFGGRRRSTVPLVTEALDWEHGVFLGSIMASETTAAAQGAVGKLRFDPMAMLPFCGYNMADYFDHWLSIGKVSSPNRLPPLFFVNWFRRDEDGRFLWPGFGENSRVLKWVFERVDGDAEAVETPIGLLPATGAIDTTGLDITDDDMTELLAVDVEGWRHAIPQIREHYARFGDDIPAALQLAVDTLERRLADT